MNTLDYYNKNASEFVKGTIGADFTETQSRFASLFEKGAYILDFGCGSGRDAGYFIDNGFKVDATDGSRELCRLAGEYTGLDVKCMLFSELDAVDKYDGIWACASVLHLPKTELKDVFHKMLTAVKSGGYIYTSFKYGEFEGERNGRYFTYFTEDSFKEFVTDITGIHILDMWITSDVRPGREDEKWLNTICRVPGTVNILDNAV